MIGNFWRVGAKLRVIAIELNFGPPAFRRGYFLGRIEERRPAPIVRAFFVSTGWKHFILHAEI